MGTLGYLESIQAYTIINQLRVFPPRSPNIVDPVIGEHPQIWDKYIARGLI